MSKNQDTAGGRNARRRRRGGKGFNRANRPRFKGKGNCSVTFMGDTKEMHFHVFEVRSEHHKKGQFYDTVNHLRLYPSATYKKEIKILKLLFDRLETPAVDRSVAPSKKSNWRKNPVTSRLKMMS